ncbi:MAG: hypothetical protein HQL80_09335, partial [Magnetococcales bacterium]|nr:hypothetical protein [Magnetococcales bacterium]
MLRAVGMSRLVLVAVWLCVGLATAVGQPAQGWAKTHYHWVQLVEGKQVAGQWLPGVSVRAIVDDQDGCPPLYATPEMKKEQLLFTLTERPKQGSVATGKGFAEIKVCEHLLQPEDPLLQKFTTGYLKR